MNGRFRLNICLFIAAVTLSVAAQTQPPESWFAGKLHPCTGEKVQVTAVSQFTETGEVTTITLLGVSKEWNVYQWRMIPESELSDFIHGVIGLAGLACGSGGSTSLPATAAAATFKQAVFTNLAKPRIASPSPQKSTAPVPSGTSDPTTTNTTTSAAMDAANAETENPAETGKAVQLEAATKASSPRLSLPPNNVTTDLEWNLFRQNGASGNNYALRAGYSRTSGDQKLTYGGTLIINTMIMLDKLFFNNALNLFGTYMIAQTASLERKLGGSLNSFLVDEKFYDTPFGMSLAASFSDNWFVRSDNVLTYGAIAQQSFIGDVKTTLLTAGVLYGLPLAERYALNANALYALNLLTMGKDGKVDIDSPMMLQPAVSFTMYFTKLFSLDVGFKKTLLIKDYNDNIFTLGSVVLF